MECIDLWVYGWKRRISSFWRSENRCMGGRIISMLQLAGADISYVLQFMLVFLHSHAGWELSVCGCSVTHGT